MGSQAPSSPSRFRRPRQRHHRPRSRPWSSHRLPNRRLEPRLPAGNPGASAVGRTNWLGGLTAASGTIAMLLFFICGFVFDGWGWSWLFFFLPALVGAFARVLGIDATECTAPPVAGLLLAAVLARGWARPRP